MTGCCHDDDGDELDGKKIDIHGEHDNTDDPSNGVGHDDRFCCT